MSCYDQDGTVYGLVRDIFCAAAVTCFLAAAHRVACALLLTSRLAAYDEVSDEYTPEERELLIHKIKHGSMHY
jgi:hypothetical protein